MFSRFTHLPLEVQFMVWELALPEPRRIYLENSSIKFYSVAAKDSNPENLSHLWIVCPPPVPVLLHTCRFSRQVALKHFELILDRHPFPHEAKIRSIFVDGLPLRRGRSRGFNKRPTLFSNSGKEFPYHDKAPVYVDLKNDIFTTRTHPRWDSDKQVPRQRKYHHRIMSSIPSNGDLIETLWENWKISSRMTRFVICAQDLEYYGDWSQPPRYFVLYSPFLDFDPAQPTQFNFETEKATLSRGHSLIEFLSNKKQLETSARPTGRFLMKGKENMRKAFFDGSLDNMRTW